MPDDTCGLLPQLASGGYKLRSRRHHGPATWVCRDTVPGFRSSL